MIDSKKIIIVLLAIGVAFASCDFAWQRYTSKEYGFSIMLPRIWFKEEGQYNTVIMATAPREGPGDKFQENINVVVTDLPRSIPLETFFELNKVETLKAIPGEEFNITEGEVTIGRFRGKSLSFNSRIQGITIRTLSVIWMNGKRVYVVSCSAEHSQFPKYEPIFTKAIHSMQIR
jgi:hypothetical protein